jgi:ATP-binding cassette subfamily B protein
VVARVTSTVRRPLGVALLAGIAWQLVTAALPIVLGWAIDHGIEEGQRSAIWLAALAVIGLGLAEAVTDAVRHRAENSASARVAAHLRAAVVGAALRARDEDRDRFPPGDVVARATADVDEVAELTDALGYSAGFALTAPVLVGAIAVIDPLMGAVALAGAVATALCVWGSAGTWQARSTAMQEAMGATVERAQETLEGFKTVRGLGAEGQALARFDAASRELRDRARSLSNLWIGFSPLLETLSFASVVGVLWIGGERVLAGDLGVGAVVAAVGLALTLATPVRALADWAVHVQGALASATRIGELLDAVPPAARSGDAVGGAPAVDLDGVDFAYPARPGELVLRGASVRLRAGQLALVRGPVGSGKSTLLRLIAGLRVPVGGSVRRTGSVLLVEQAPFIFGASVRENLRIGRRDADADDLADAVAIAGASELVAGLPDGLDTELDDRGATLSGGERQRLALARAVLAAPDVLLLDGATSDLEPAREARIIGALADRFGGGIVVVVTPNHATGAATTILVADGRAETAG